MVTCINCIDIENPTKRSVLRQRQWAEADAEFLRTMIMNKSNKEAVGCSSPSFLGSASSVYSEKPDKQGEFALRQKYLRSYTFTKKDQSRTKRWRQFKEKPAILNIKGSAGKSERPSSIFAAAGRLFSCVVAGKVEVDQYGVL